MTTFIELFSCKTFEQKPAPTVGATHEHIPCIEIHVFLCVILMFKHATCEHTYMHPDVHYIYMHAHVRIQPDFPEEEMIVVEEALEVLHR